MSKKPTLEDYTALKPGVNYRWNGKQFEIIPDDTVAVKFDAKTKAVSYVRRSHMRSE